MSSCITRYLLISVGSGCEPANQLWYVDLEALPRGSDGALDLRSFDHFAKGGGKLPVKKVQIMAHALLTILMAGSR